MPLCDSTACVLWPTV